MAMFSAATHIDLLPAKNKVATTINTMVAVGGRWPYWGAGGQQKKRVLRSSVETIHWVIWAPSGQVAGVLVVAVRFGREHWNKQQHLHLSWAHTGGRLKSRHFAFLWTGK